MVKPGQRGLDEVVLACGSRRFYGGDDTATGASDLFITRACKPQFEFIRAIAAVDKVGGA